MCMWAGYLSQVSRVPDGVFVRLEKAGGQMTFLRWLAMQGAAASELWRIAALVLGAGHHSTLCYQQPENRHLCFLKKKVPHLLPSFIFSSSFFFPFFFPPFLPSWSASHLGLYLALFSVFHIMNAAILCSLSPSFLLSWHRLLPGQAACKSGKGSSVEHKLLDIW